MQNPRNSNSIVIQPNQLENSTIDSEGKTKTEEILSENGLREQEEEAGEKRLRICGDESAEELLLPIRTSPLLHSPPFPSVAAALRLEKTKKIFRFQNDAVLLSS